MSLFTDDWVTSLGRSQCLCLRRNRHAFLFGRVGQSSYQSNEIQITSVLGIWDALHFSTAKQCTLDTSKTLVVGGGVHVVSVFAYSLRCYNARCTGNSSSVSINRKKSYEGQVLFIVFSLMSLRNDIHLCIVVFLFIFCKLPMRFA